MEYKFMKTQKKHLDRAAEMMSHVWDFNKHFLNVRKPNKLFKLILKYYLIESDYTEVVLNEDERVQGYLFGGPTKLSYIKGLRQAALLLSFLRGDLGNRRKALKVIMGFQSDLGILMRNKDYFDNEVKLFFIDEKAKGLGLEKELMDRYVRHCRGNNNKDIVLMTDSGSGRRFYDQYGFRKLKQAHSPFFPEPEKEHNVFSYVYEVS